MNKALFILKQYVTKILIVPLCAYAFLSYGCPTCEHRLEENSPAFFLDHNANQITQEPHVALETTSTEQMENHHA